MRISDWSSDVCSSDLWVYVFDGSGYQDPTPGAIAYYYSPDRKGVHPADHLANFSGVMHADGYGGYKKLYGNQIVEAACMAHVRRKFHDVIKLKPSPIADAALSRLGAPYDIETGRASGGARGGQYV